MDLEFHEIANTFPLLEGVAFDELVEDIRTNGLQFPIILFEDKILDGRNRYRAACQLAQEADEPETYYYFSEPYIGQDPMQYVLSLNLHRRHLSESQRAMIAAEISDTEPSKRTGAGQMSIQQAAETMNVGERTVKSAKRVQKDGVPELVQSVKDGDTTVGAAEKVAQLPKPKQKNIVKNKVTKQAAKKIRDDKKQRAHTDEPYDLYTIEIVLCEFCLNGEGGYCQSPGCGLYKRQSPDFALDQFSTITKNTSAA